jgi:hypothetical protein
MFVAGNDLQCAVASACVELAGVSGPSVDAVVRGPKQPQLRRATSWPRKAGFLDL